MELWKILEEIFHDNKHTRAIYLEEQFSNHHLENLTNMADYCKQLKVISDQLSNVGNLVSDQKMVLQLVAGLTKGEYDTIATLIQQYDPLPSFHKARSQVILEETRRSRQDDHTQYALVTTPDTTTTATYSQPNSSHQGGGKGGKGKGKGGWKNGKGKGRGKQGSPNFDPHVTDFGIPQQQMAQQPAPYINWLHQLDRTASRMGRTSVSVSYRTPARVHWFPSSVLPPW